MESPAVGMQMTEAVILARRVVEIKSAEYKARLREFSARTNSTHPFGDENVVVVQNGLCRGQTVCNPYADHLEWSEKKVLEMSNKGPRVDYDVDMRRINAVPPPAPKKPSRFFNNQ